MTNPLCSGWINLRAGGQLNSKFRFRARDIVAQHCNGLLEKIDEFSSMLFKERTMVITLG